MQLPQWFKWWALVWIQLPYKEFGHNQIHNSRYTQFKWWWGATQSHAQDDTKQMMLVETIFQAFQHVALCFPQRQSREQWFQKVQIPLDFKSMVTPFEKMINYYILVWIKLQSNRANTTPCTPGVNLFELPQGCVSLQHHHVQPVKGIYLRKWLVLVGRATRITQSKMLWDLTGWSSLWEIIELCWLSSGCILTWLRTHNQSDSESCKTWICLKTGYLVLAPKWQL